MFYIGPGCQIDPSAKIDVLEGYLGAGSVIRENVVIEGRRVIIGRESFLDRGSYIGGGSCFAPTSFLEAGDWLHMGINSHVNTAMGVRIGDVVGLGVETKIFTHGAYLDSLNLGAPVQWAGVIIGSNVWLPNAWVNPGVTIGNNVVVSARSLINSDIPDGCLYGGIPARLLRQDYLPRELTYQEKQNLMKLIVEQVQARTDFIPECKLNLIEDDVLKVSSENFETRFTLSKQEVSGNELIGSLIVKDQLRRNGIRFRFSFEDGNWRAWNN